MTAVALRRKAAWMLAQRVADEEVVWWTPAGNASAWEACRDEWYERFLATLDVSCAELREIIDAGGDL